MTDKEEHHSQGYRGHPRSYRGRPAQNRIYQHLGVRDLREIIDRKRTEREHFVEPGRPPDSSYNYLKDSFRESGDHNSQESPKHSTNIRKYKNPNYNNYRRDKEHHKGLSPNQQMHKDIENPLNIKVEFSTSTGEHSYKFDETTTLPTIKHIPDHLPVQNRPFRGRGRGTGVRTYQTRTIRNNRKPQNDGGTTLHVKPQNDGGRTLHVQEIPGGEEENWDNELNETQVNTQGAECQDCAGCDKCNHLHDEYEDHQQELQDEDYGLCQVVNVGLEKDVENLKLAEGNSVSLDQGSGNMKQENLAKGKTDESDH